MKLPYIPLGLYRRSDLRNHSWNTFVNAKLTNVFKIRVWPLLLLGRWGISIVKLESEANDG